MGIERPGETPQFYAYPKSYAIVSKDIPEDDWPLAVKKLDPSPITIPAYQRKIVWGSEQVKEFLESKAVLFGTVIMADDHKSLILLDGLQRFATSTALLNCLYPLVLAPEPSEPTHAENFDTFRANIGGFKPIFAHNHDMLMNHMRNGIAKSYESLYKKIEKLVKEEFKNRPDEFIQQINNTFNHKQIAIDKYYGFKNSSELIQTFININSTGINLKEVDLLRSEIISKAEELNWDKDDAEAIDNIENEFTRIFSEIRGAVVLGKNLYDAIHDKNNERGAHVVFKNWDALKKDDVDKLLEFIENISRASELEINDRKKYPYLYEIFQCGHLPFALTTWYFYQQNLDNNIPDFMKDGNHNTVQDRRLLLRALYRRLIDGSIGRIGPIVTEFIQHSNKYSMCDLAEKINSDTLSGSLYDAPHMDWLKPGLRKANVSRARRIFNACLLPDRDGDENVEFNPLEYGRRDNQWNIDHIIPKAKYESVKKSYDNIDLLVNLSPLPSNINIGIKNTPCNIKLNPDEQKYHEAHQSHPYIKWLCMDHYKKYQNKIIGKDNVLNNPECLELNYDIAVGDDRIEKIAEILSNKI